MVDLDYLSGVAMQLITYAGCAKSTYIQAMQLSKEKKFEDANAKIKEADSILAQAHTQHLELLQREATEMQPQVSLLIIHAEDQMMSCETIKLMVMEFIHIYRKPTI